MWIAASLCARSGEADPSPAGRPASRPRSLPRVLTREGGRLRVTGADALQNMEVARWAQRISRDVERATATRLPPPSSHVLRIEIAPPVAEGKGAVTFFQEARDGGLAQRLVIAGYDEAEYAQAERALCRLLLDARVAARQTPADRRAGLRGAPEWMVIGVARALLPSRRAENSAAALALWQAGRLASLGQLLAAGSAAPSEAVCGALVQWLSGLPDGKRFFDAAFGAIAGGEELTAARLAACAGPGVSAADLDGMWDAWLLRQKRVVYVAEGPARTTPALLDQLRSQLLIHPRDRGISVDGDPDRILTFADLIARRGEEWVPAFARNRSAALRLLAVGREAEFGAAAEAYAAFLDALAEGLPETGLAGLLRKAEAAAAGLGDADGEGE